MTRRPRLLDLFSGAGGAAMGYHRAGFDVTGVDIAPQPRYPFTFHQANALMFLAEHGHEFDAIHASPVCKRYSACAVLNDREHPDQISDTRTTLAATGRPWVIENVPGAPLHSPVTLCGCMFRIRTYRPRLFETSGFDLPQLSHRPHTSEVQKMGRPPQNGEYIHIIGHFSNVTLARQVMGMPWATRDELAQAVPVTYTEYIGRFLLRAVGEVAA